MDGTHLLTPYTVWYGELELHGKQNFLFYFCLVLPDFG